MTVPRILRNKFNEKYKTCIPETRNHEKNDLNKQKNISCSWIENLKIKMPEVLKLTTDSM